MASALPRTHGSKSFVVRAAGSAFGILASSCFSLISPPRSTLRVDTHKPHHTFILTDSLPLSHTPRVTERWTSLALSLKARDSQHLSLNLLPQKTPVQQCVSVFTAATATFQTQTSRRIDVTFTYRKSPERIHTHKSPSFSLLISRGQLMSHQDNSLTTDE